MLTRNLELSEDKQKAVGINNLVSMGHGKPAMQFLPCMAERLVELARIHEGNNVLDIGTGMGAAAFAAAEKTGRRGKIVGLYTGRDILENAHQELEIAANSFISFFLGDLEQLEFPDSVFDVVLSASSLFFLPDMAASLAEWKRVVKLGGRVAVSGYGKAAFRPLLDLFEARIRSYGVTLAPERPFSWRRLTEPEQYLAMFRDAGLEHIEVFSEQLGYHLKEIDGWWDVIWNSSFREPVSQLEPKALEQFKTEHLAEVKKLATPKGIWLDIASTFAIGRKSS